MPGKKRKPNPEAAALKAARANGLTVTAVSVNRAALDTATVGAVRLGAGTRGTTVNWADVPEAWLDTCSEAEWQDLVRSFAEAHGWKCYHTFDSRGSDPGPPDQTMFRESVDTGEVWLYYVELKDMTGKETKEQKEFARLVTALGCPRIRSYCWKPDKWDVAKKILSEPME